MKLKYTFEIMEMDDENIAVPVLESANKMMGVIKMNNTAMDIFEALKEETTEEEILASLVSKYDSSSKEDIAEYLHEFILKLSKAGMIE